ncbi:15-hydroxyprostaglandin dehydrogenase [NAD(+)]-like [Anoplophora glabripennis]|uniref:15-hydroxyprostaglandin dehydrogenase [NAD(+)]-like n=1 Tax=Anoplophora glabripennis TaxID=217634 RepID=UPI000873723C|nr:15-hydroxyprostaglandin dehydrogenase [NAD(+)]-like [Anoplophora glabripennis]
MDFELNGKVVLVTGGLSGIGLQFAKELLRAGVKGVTLADVNPNQAQTVLSDIEEEFGSNRALFVKTDVSDIEQFENAFKKTIATFKHVDVLINNAGVSNDKMWQKEVAINVNGVINGIILGLEKYLPKYRQGPQAVILNVSSVAGILAVPSNPIYSGTKAAIAHMTRCWGDPHHYTRTKVKVFAVCPGMTATPLIATLKETTLGEAYCSWFDSNLDAFPSQEPEHVAREGIKLIQSCPNGTIWVVENGQSAYQYVFPERETMQK